jgi:hypothetical protein
LRWVLLWCLGLFLFAHVILYPVSSHEPSPSTAGLLTVVLTAGLYGATSFYFWWYFKRIRSKACGGAQTRKATLASAA